MGAHLHRLEPLGAEAEIHAALLILYWHRNHPAILQRMEPAVRDVVFSAAHVPVGSAVVVDRFLRTHKEEALRSVLGRAAWRQCFDLADLVKRGRAEGKGTVGGKQLPDSVLAAGLLSEKPELQSWTADTCARYLTIAGRLQPARIQDKFASNLHLIIQKLQF